ncbi:MAG: MBL fold metallo-hydrolase [Betaproteobacteria bacterium]
MNRQAIPPRSLPAERVAKAATKRAAMVPAARRALSPHIALRVNYHDETEFGSTVSERCDTELRARFAVLSEYREKYGLPRLVRDAAAILKRVVPQCLEGIRGTPGRLRDEWLYPDPVLVKPAQLLVVRNLGDVTARIPVPRAVCADLASYLGDWQQGAEPPRIGAARGLWDALAAEGALCPIDRLPTVTRRPGITYVGHATLCVSDGDRQLLIDPFLLPASTLYPRDWQPLSLQELGRPDAILITHSHPDHYDVGTLLRCGADTPIFVSAVRRESVLAIDMAARLRELGFRSVHAVEDWSDFRIGAMRVVALPFYGEQPTIGETLHPEVRNQGTTYVVEVGGHRVAAVADAGLDWAGNVKDMAAQARARYGPVDTVFGGYRGFAMYPVQYVFSSVTRYLPFVPEACWGERQRIMCDADDLVDLGERWRANRVVPYAAGGAPWYWLRGLGPCLDGSAPDDTFEDTPPPRHVSDVAARRSFTRRDGPLASPLDVLTLRVGDCLPL